MLTQTQILGDRVYDYSYVVGTRNLLRPVSIAIGSGDLVIWLMRGGAAMTKISKLSIGNTAGDEEIISEFGKLGYSEGEFIWPAGIAVDSKDNVYVTDEWLNRVLVFSKNDEFLGHWGTPGNGDGELHRPSGIAIDYDENIYIADTGNHRIQKFTRDGEVLANWGSFGSDLGQMDSPWGLTTDNAGNVYVTDHKNNRVQKFTSEGAYISKFGCSGTGRGALSRPSDVAVDPDGDVYICDWANSRVQVYDPDGGFITGFVGDAHDLSKWQKQTVSSNPDEAKARRRVRTMEPQWRFALPMGVEFHPKKGWLMVVDSQRNRVQIYSKLTDYVEPQFNI